MNLLRAWSIARQRDHTSPRPLFRRAFACCFRGNADGFVVLASRVRLAAPSPSRSASAEALQLNVHFHVLVPDGGFDAHCARERSELAKCPVPTDDGIFVADEAPDDDDVRRIMVRAGRRVMSKLSRFFSTTTTIAGARLTASSNFSMRRRPPLSLCSFPAMRGGRRCRRSSRASRCMPPRG